MRRFSTVVCCIMLALYGAFIATTTHRPMNTVRAGNSLDLSKNLCKLVRDTVTKTDTIRDTVRVKPKVKIKYRIKHVKDTVEKEVPVLYTRSCRHRKESAPDTLLLSDKKRVTRKVIELNEESETR